MSARDYGGSAFPVPPQTIETPMQAAAGGGYIAASRQLIPGSFGMTLRDYFAAKAMQAAATNPTGADGFTFEQRAEWAYQQADAMLAERSK